MGVTKKIIIIEGADKVGKSTTIEYLKQYIESTGKKARVIKTPVSMRLANVYHLNHNAYTTQHINNFLDVLEDIHYHLFNTDDFFIFDRSFLSSAMQVYFNSFKESFQAVKPEYRKDWISDSVLRVHFTDTMFIQGGVEAMIELTDIVNADLKNIYQANIHIHPFILRTADDKPLAADEYLTDKNEIALYHALYRYTPDFKIDAFTPYKSVIPENNYLTTTDGIKNTIKSILLGCGESTIGVEEWAKINLRGVI